MKWIIPVLLALSLVYVPSFWVAVFVLIDYYTPWVLFESKLYDQYHQFLVGRLTEKPEIPLPEIDASEATYESVLRLTKGYSFPLIIRGLGKNTSAVEKWSDLEWWIENYGNEELLCGTFSQVVEDCSVRGFFEAIKAGKPFYVSGASVIFERHPELRAMIDSAAIAAIEPSDRTATQIFMGTPGMGSDIHCAIGVNVFRMVAGRKKWWFIPTSQTPYLKPSINFAAISAHTQTLVGKNGTAPSPWLSKLTRYTTVMGPGDVLVNPPWFWHGIDNLPVEHDGISTGNELVIGSPVRYGPAGIGIKAALGNNAMYTINSIAQILRKYGLTALKPGFRMNLQSDIANGRRTREQKDTKEDWNEFNHDDEKEEKAGQGLHPFDEAD